MIAREVSCECLSSEFSNRLYACHKFDYAALDSRTRLLAQEHAREIKSLLRQSADNMFQIGQSLIDVKQSLPHGCFCKWIDSEFNWSESSARKFMQVARQFKTVKITDLNITTSAILALARNSVPDRARDEAIARARQGEVIESKIAKEIINRHKQFMSSTERMTVDIDNNSQTVDVDAEVVREPELESIELLANLQLNDSASTDNSSEQIISGFLNEDPSSARSLGNLCGNLATESETRKTLDIEIVEPFTVFGLADESASGNPLAASIKSMPYEQIVEILAAIAQCTKLTTFNSANSADKDILMSIVKYSQLLVKYSQLLAKNAKHLLEQVHFQD